MKNQALISVIIPVYNVEEYLRECVDSVLNQTYKNLEIILVDDGSTDSSGEICDEYLEKDERITVIHQKNGGLSAARNTGFSETNGNYVYFVDSDDYIDEKTLEILLETAEKDNSDIVFFDAISFADTYDFTVNQNYLRKNKYLTGNGIAVFSELTKNKEFHSAVPLLFINKKILSDSNIKFIPDILYEDMVFTYQIFCKAATVSQCPDALYHRRYRKNSIMTSSKTKKHFTSCMVVCKINTKFTSETLGEDVPSANYKYLTRCAFNVFNVYEKLCKNDKKTCKKELKKFKKDVLQMNAYGNKALKMRCYGKTFWIIYKIFEKTVGRLMKGAK